MFPRSPYLLPLGLLTGVALLSFWLEQAAKSGSADETTALGAPDAIVENFRSTLDSQDGRPLYNLTAKRLRYYGKLDQSYVDNPVLEHLDETNGAVTITSQQATIEPDGDAILFAGHATLTHVAPATKQIMTLRSEQINAYPKQHLVKSPTRVNVDRPGMQVTAEKLELDTERRILKLHGRVKVQYKTI